MAFESLADFFMMGKHGAFVWSAYAITMAILVWNIVLPIMQRKKIQQEILALWQREKRS
jgi:heme exporter protein D